MSERHEPFLEYFISMKTECALERAGNFFKFENGTIPPAAYLGCWQNRIEEGRNPFPIKT